MSVTDGKFCEEDYDDGTVSITDINKTIAELEADANRYRWLREQNANLDHDSFVVLAHDCTAEDEWQKYWAGSDLDKAIDEAMLAEMKAT